MSQRREKQTERWDEIIYEPKEIEREVCRRGRSSNWLEACVRVLKTNDEILAQSERFEQTNRRQQLLIRRQRRQMSALFWLNVFLCALLAWAVCWGMR